MARQSDDRSVVSMLWRLFSRHYDESRVLSVYTLKVETFAGRNFRDFAIFSAIRES